MNTLVKPNQIKIAIHLKRKSAL